MQKLFEWEDASYIDVLCEGEFTETVEKYVLNLVLQVTATKDDTALDEVMQLKERCVKHLLDSGIQRAELFDGGTNLTRPWYRQKKIGKEASAKLSVQTEDIKRLSQAVHAIEQVKNSQREAIQMTMRSPVFGADEALVTQALQTAIRRAKEKAAILAASAELELAGVYRIEELSRAKRDSGAYGDEDWWGDSMRFLGAVAGGAASADEEEITLLDLESPKRTIWVRYKVRFAVKAS